MQRVVGFVNIRFTAIHCAEYPPIAQQTLLWTPTSNNCESEMDAAHPGDKMADHCSDVLNAAWYAGGGPPTRSHQGKITIEADITCDAPVGPLDVAGDPIPPTFKPRLVQ